MKIPEEIIVTPAILKKKGGAPTTIEKRRKSTPVQGKVRGKRSHFTDKEKLNAVCVFAVAGNSRRVAEITGIPEGTIRSWKNTVWWNEAMHSIIVEQDESLATDLTNLINKAVGQVNDRLEHGDYIYDAKRGTLVRKPVNAKDLAIVTAITVDKRQLIRGQPTSRVEQVSVDETLKNLAAEFKKFSLAKTVVPESEVIEAEIVEEEEEEDGPTINEMFSE